MSTFDHAEDDRIGHSEVRRHCGSQRCRGSARDEDQQSINEPISSSCILWNYVEGYSACLGMDMTIRMALLSSLSISWLTSVATYLPAPFFKLLVLPCCSKHRQELLFCHLFHIQRFLAIECCYIFASSVCNLLMLGPVLIIHLPHFPRVIR